MPSQLIRILSLVTVLLVLPVSRAWAATVESNSVSGDVLLLDNLGRVVVVPTNEVPSGLGPPSDMNLNRQIPEPTPGSIMSDEVLQRTREGEAGFQLFPAVPPVLMPYLASQDEFGNTVTRPGVLIPFAPSEPLVQGGKYWLSERGFRYSLEQTFTCVTMTDVKGSNMLNTLEFYTFDLKSKWAIFGAPDAGTAGWISSQIDAKIGFNPDAEKQSPKSNLGTVTEPAGIWSGVNGVRVPELAWQQSLRDGEIVVVAGMVNQGNYIDQNAYAQSGRNQFFNSALIDSMVLPLASYNFGLNLQWQPLPEWYAMLGGNVGHAPAGFSPWTDFNENDWSLVGEIGYAPKDFLGLGPGIYRIQPFLARVTGLAQTSYTVTIPGTTNSTDVTVNSTTNSRVQAGLCFDFQQQLGSKSPFGWFGRFGFGGSEVSAGAAAQVGTGFVMQGPFKHLLFQRTSNDILGVGFVWSQPSATTESVYHQNEYILETKYALQLTPTIKIQPDMQVIWDPAHNPNGRATVFQLQLAMSW
jgi:porin